MTPTTTVTTFTTLTSAFDRALEFVRPGRRRRILWEPHVALPALLAPPGTATGGSGIGPGWRS